MFSLHDFVMKTLLGMVGNEPDYKVREYALGWYDKARLTGEDMAQLDEAIHGQYAEPETSEIPEEESTSNPDDVVE